MPNIKYILLFLFLTLSSLSQDGFDIEMYIYTYYATDDRDDPNAPFRSLSVINGQKDQFGLNQIQLSASKTTKNYRGLATLQFGNIVDQAYAQTPTPYKWIQQAYGGIRLTKGLWLDVGLFTTHIGGEMLLPKDNWLSSHSMLTFSEPFYNEGARLLYELESGFNFGLFLYNSIGNFIEDNDAKTIGYLSSYTKNSLFISWAGQFGSEKAENLFVTYNNFNIQYTFSKQWEAKAQFDIATS